MCQTRNYTEISVSGGFLLLKKKKTLNCEVTAERERGRGGCCRATDAGGEIRRDHRRKYLTSCLSSSAGSRQIIQVVIPQTTSTPSVRTLPKDEFS